jgi:hypothetical protein
MRDPSTSFSTNKIPSYCPIVCTTPRRLQRSITTGKVKWFMAELSYGKYGNQQLLLLLKHVRLIRENSVGVQRVQKLHSQLLSLGVALPSAQQPSPIGQHNRRSSDTLNLEEAHPADKPKTSQSCPLTCKTTVRQEVLSRRLWITL